MALASFKPSASEPVSIDVIKTHFNEADKDADGILDWDELVAARKQMGHKDPVADAHKVLGLWDKNRDGNISLEEFLDYNRPHWRDEDEAEVVTRNVKNGRGFTVAREVTRNLDILTKKFESSNFGFLWRAQ